VADQLARRVFVPLFIGPELACGTSERVGKWIIRDWVCREHQECWQSSPEERHAKVFLSELSGKRLLSF
jgi:hypothetical protein